MFQMDSSAGGIGNGLGWVGLGGHFRNPDGSLYKITEVEVMRRSKILDNILNIRMIRSGNELGLGWKRQIKRTVDLSN